MMERLASAILSSKPGSGSVASEPAKKNCARFKTGWPTNMASAQLTVPPQSRASWPTKSRESEMQKEATKFGPFTEFASDSPLTFEEARKFIDNAEILRQQFLSDNDRAALAQLQQIVADNRHYANSWARDPGLDEATRAEQFEIAEWLKVWIQTP